MREVFYYVIGETEELGAKMRKLGIESRFRFEAKKIVRAPGEVFEHFCNKKLVHKVS